MPRKIISFFCFVGLYSVSGNLNCFAETTLQDIRDAVVQTK